MKTSRAFLILVVAAVAAAGPRPLHAGTCPAAADPRPDGVCPINVGPASFDRCVTSNPLDPKPTAIGNTACNALRDANKLIRSLGASANNAVAEAQRDMRDLVTVVMKDAVNPDAAAKFTAARREANEIVAEVRGLVNDRTCGVNGSLKRTQTFFTDLGNHLVATGNIAAKVSAAAGATAPAVPEIGNALAELAMLAGDIQQAGQAAETERKKLEDALKRLQKGVGDLAALDLTGAIGSGGKLVTTVGPFTANCGACVSAISASIGAAAAAIGSAGAGAAACPETGGGGCVVGIPVSAVSGAGSALAGAVGSVPCATATADIARMGEYVAAITEFVNSSVKVAQSLQQNVEELQKAGNALAGMARQLPRQLKPRVDRIAASIDKAGDSVNAGIGIMETQVAPRIERLTTAVVQQLGSSTDDMYTCWKRMTVAATRSGQDAVDGIGLLLQASTGLVDGGQVVDNIERQGQDAVNAAGQAARSNWTAVRSSYATLHRDLWGVSLGTTDLGKTATHVADLALHPDRLGNIAQDLRRLADKLGKLVQASVDAGKTAFLDRDRLKIQSRQKFDSAESQARRALRELAKADAKAMAKANNFKSPPGKPVVNIVTMPKSARALKVNKIGPSLRLKP